MSSLSNRSLRSLPWLFCFQFFVAEQVARLNVAGPYSMALNAISDLGAVHAFHAAAPGPSSVSPLHGLMNASFTLQGLLICFGAVKVRRLFPPGALAGSAILSFILSGLTLCVVGLNPEDVHSAIHVLAAAAHFISGALAMLLVGFALLRRNRLAGASSIAAGALALSATLLLGLRAAPVWESLGVGVGTVERVAAYPLPIWLTATGLVLLTRQREAETSGIST